MVMIDGKNKMYERAKQSVRNALRELRHAKDELGKAYESGTTEMDGLIEDVECKLKDLER